MDFQKFQELLDAADYNTEQAQNEASIKRYSSQLPPPKKLPKSNVQSDGVQRFLAKKKREEDERAKREKLKKEQLLALRAKSTKNNKKAKIMASRTKDNDFSKFRITEDEMESKRKIEIELQKKHLADKVERMKARIVMEDKEKLLPRKRKRKSKHPEGEESKEESGCLDTQNELVCSDKELKKKIRKPPPPAFSFHELLKVAETKQYEPIVIPKKKQEDEKLLTKKERKLYEEEQERLRRKQKRLEGKDRAQAAKKNAASTNKSQIVPEKGDKRPVIVRAEKAAINPAEKKKNAENQISSKPSTQKVVDKYNRPSNTTNQNTLGSKCLGPSGQERTKSSIKPVIKNGVHRPETSLKPPPAKLVKKKISLPAPAPPPPQMPAFDAEALALEIEKKVRERLQKEMDAKYEAKFATLAQKSAAEKAKPTIPISKIKQNGTPPIKKTGMPPPKKEAVKVKPAPRRENVAPFERAFHPNPYLAPPTRRLEPIRPQKTLKRRIESDDEDDDDDMSDFIDDRNGPTSEYDENYSKYIQEMFGYDRNKYADVDDDDIMETSYAEIQKEETRSAKLAYLEDLEEERKLREEEKMRNQRRKQKHKK